MLQLDKWFGIHTVLFSLVNIEEKNIAEWEDRKWIEPRLRIWTHGDLNKMPVIGQTPHLLHGIQIYNAVAGDEYITGRPK